MTCHTQAAGRTLGPEVAQLNADFTYALTNRISNQMATLSHIGVLANPPASLDDAPRLVDPLGTAGINERANAYLHTNCAGCHRADAALRVDFDLRRDLPLTERGICNVDPVGSDLGIQDAKLMVPGQPEHSLMVLRASRRDANAMPPLGSSIHDAQGVAVLETWIRTVQTCE